MSGHMVVCLMPPTLPGSLQACLSP